MNAKDYSKEYKALLKILKSSHEQIFAENDSDFERNLKNQLAERDADYTNLLDNFIDITKTRNTLKEIHKWIFFWLIIIAAGIGIWIICSVFSSITKSNDLQFIIDSIPILISAFVSFIATIIAVPRIIAEFLFNTNEDENITKIILHTQEHDETGRGFFPGFHKNNSNSQKTKNNNNSPEIIYSDSNSN